MKWSLPVCLIFFFSCLFPTALLAQSPGIVVRPAGGNGVTILNPDGNGYASATTAGFTTNDISQSEIPFKIIAPIITEPTGDLATGPSGGFTDIVKSLDNSGFYLFSDGTNLLFRLRIGGIISGSKGYSILIDTDGKFGNTGVSPDPNYIAPTNTSNGNPGFEYEVVLQTNFQVAVYNVDGNSSPVLITSFPLNTHSQISVALTTDSGNPDYFYDFTAPLSSIGSPASMRFVATTVTSPSSALQGSRSDIYGINDANTKVSNGWISVIDAQPPVTPTDLTSGGAGAAPTCTAAPVINAPVSTGSNITVSGTWNRMDVSKPVSATITLYKNGVSAGTTTVNTSQAWNIIVANIVPGDVFYAKAQSAGESMCMQSASINAGCAIATASPVLTCASSKGISGTMPAGSTILVYLVPTTNASPLSNPLTTNMTYPTSTTFAYFAAGCSGGTSNVVNGTYMLITSNAGCNSSPIFECISSGSSALAGLTTNALTLTTPIFPFQTTINGSGSVSGNILRLFINGKFISTITATASAFSFTGLSLKANDQIRIYESSGTSCMTVSNPFQVSCYSQPAIITTNSSGKLLATATSISGISNYSGASVTLYKGIAPSGVATGSVATTAANGDWTVTGLTLASGDNFYATLTNAGCVAQPSASAAVLAPTTACPVITGTYTDAATAVNGTIPGPFTGTIRLFLDGSQIGSAAISAATTWNINSVTFPLYPGAILTVSAQASGNSENASCVSSATVGCTSPAAPVVTPLSASVLPGQSVTYNISNISANAWYALMDNSGVSYATSVYKSNTTGFSIITRPFSSEGTYSLKLSADNLNGCAASFQTATVTVSATLPLRLLEFNASVAGKIVNLYWKTTSEVNVSHFEIEKSADGRNFSFFDKVAAFGTQTTNSYKIQDIHPTPGLIYYRLRSVDIDGRSTYSKVVSLKTSEPLSLSVTPNPFSDKIVVGITLAVRNEITVRIFDNLGRQVHVSKKLGEAGQNILSCEGLQSLQAGIYLVKVTAGTETAEKKLIKPGK
ncbi:MAG: T9SS type A sorting domain-containing protein [Gemmatimonadaceae bacterium]|nr:T9SS type A sorting domain-containing protein [Chitinophagaceae bacterium]